MGARSWVVIAVVVLLAGCALMPPIDAAPIRGTETNHVATTDYLYVAATGDYGYTPDTFNDLPAHATINVTFVDNSTMTDGHTFTILGVEGVQIPNTDTQTQINALAFGNNPRALFNLNVSSYGDRNVSQFQSPGPGWYEFVCTVSSHFQEGMYGFIAFGMDLPSNLTLPDRVGIGGSTLSFSPVDAAAIAALVLVFVLGYVVWQRRRASSRMPPAPVRPSKPAAAEGHPPEVSRTQGGR